MIYITGDTHSDFTRFTEDQFPILGAGKFEKDYLTDYFQKIMEKCEFKKWYFGHYHDYRQVNSQFVLLYEVIIPLEFENNF